jgi:putative N6-adenine-specific DNA methylase
MFAATAPGLKPFALIELQDLGLAPAVEGQKGGQVHLEEGAGGVAFQGSHEDLFRANLHLRTASRVLVRLGEFQATAFSELRKKAARLPWEQFLKPAAPLALRVTCRKSRLYHSGGVAERVAGAIADRLGKAPVVVPFDEKAEAPLAQLVVVRLVNDQVSLSIDSSGESLHRRGYRKATAKAPLRETLAAAMLYAGGWQGGSPLLDPFCGSGTIPIEAALLARKAAPGRARSFAFMDWPSFNQSTWEQELERALERERVCNPLIYGSDRDAGAVRMAAANAARAGVHDCIEFSQKPISAVEVEGTGIIISNPPYGLRVSKGKDLRNLYDQFGNVLKARYRGWQIVLLGSQKQLLTRTGVNFESYISTTNGGVNVFMAVGRVE